MRAEMPPVGRVAPLREIIDSHLSQLSADLEGSFEARVAAEVAARTKVQREFADRVNQAARRMRQAPTAEELSATLVTAAAPFAAHVVLFEVIGETAQCIAARGVPETQADSLRQLTLSLKTAAAFAHAIESKDPV